MDINVNAKFKEDNVTFLSYLHVWNKLWYNFSTSVGHQRGETIGETSPSGGTIGDLELEGKDWRQSKSSLTRRKNVIIGFL